MNRKDFVKNSLMVLGGLSIAPNVIALNRMDLTTGKELVINRHNRHGFFGEDAVRNILHTSSEISIQLDHFENPDGDLLLIQLITQDDTKNIGLNDKECWLENKKHPLTPEQCLTYDMKQGVLEVVKSKSIPQAAQEVLIINREHHRYTSRISPAGFKSQGKNEVLVYLI